MKTKLETTKQFKSNSAWMCPCLQSSWFPTYDQTNDMSHWQHYLWWLIDMVPLFKYLIIANIFIVNLFMSIPSCRTNSQLHCQMSSSKSMIHTVWYPMIPKLPWFIFMFPNKDYSSHFLRGHITHFQANPDWQLLILVKPGAASCQKCSQWCSNSKRSWNIYIYTWNILSRKDRNNNSTCFHNVQLSSENSESKLISLYFSISQVF